MKPKEKQDLEEAIKGKVFPLLEETMEKNWGITIPKLETDITDSLKNPQLNIYIPPHLNFNQAKNHFKGEFVKRELRLNKGNVSQLAKLLGINRRSVHRVIKDLNIDKSKDPLLSKEEYHQDVIGQSIKSTLDQYKQIIHPQQMEKMYQEVDTLSRNIAKFIPFEELSWKDAEREFERQFLQQALRENDNHIGKTAQKMELRVETLYRKIKKLGLK